MSSSQAESTERVPRSSLTLSRRIHKAKYDEDDDDDKRSTKSAKSSTRSKSKSRHFLGLNNKARSNTATSS